MRKKCVFLYVLGITLALFWVSYPSASSQDSDKLANQHFKKAIDLLKQTQYRDAIAEYEKVIGLLPDSEIALDARYWIGQSYFQMGKHDEALSIFKKLIQEYPGSAIAPVTQLMVARVEKEKKSAKARAKRDASADKKIIIDPETGVKYHKIGSLTGKKDVIDHSWVLSLSPNGRFLLYENLVIPLNEEEPFNLVDMDAWRGIWSPDGKKVAFYTSEGPIWIVPVSPETGRAIGPPKKILDIKFGWQRSVSWSPDSEKIVFFGTEGEYQGNIWTVSIKNGALTQITDDPVFEMNPIWSPDGKTIAYNKSRSEIWAVSPDGENPRKIIDVRRGSPVSWSPDSNWLLFLAPEMKYRLYRFADGRVFDINTPDGWFRAFFSWSPDGKKMLFYRPSYEYSCVLRVVSTSGGPSFELGRELKLWPYVHHWSPDSKMIITKGGYPIEPENADDLAFWMVPLAGDEAREMELDIPGGSKPQPRSLSHDCKKLLFFEEQSEDKEDLYVAPVSLKDARTIGPAIKVFEGRDKQPVGYGRRDEWAWSPDGKKLALVHGGDIWITSADKGNPLNITNSLEGESFPVWSPDGNMIAYTTSSDEEGEEDSLFIISASGGKAKKILDRVGKEQHAWSPDGNELAVISEGKILAISITGGKTREIFDLEEFHIERAGGLSWLPNGKHFAFIGEKEEEYGTRNRIYLVSEKGDKVVELAADDNNWGKDWLYPSPDGKWISYDSEGEIKVRSEGTIWGVEVEDLIKGKEKQEI